MTKIGSWLQPIHWMARSVLKVYSTAASLQFHKCICFFMRKSDWVIHWQINQLNVKVTHSLKWSGVRIFFCSVQMWTCCSWGDCKSLIFSHITINGLANLFTINLTRAVSSSLFGLNRYIEKIWKKFHAIFNTVKAHI